MSYSRLGSAATLCKASEKLGNEIGLTKMETFYILYAASREGGSQMPKPKRINGELYVSISEAAKMLDVCPATLRRWEDPDFQRAHGIKLEIVRDPVNGYRFFSERSIRNLAQRFQPA